MAVELIAKIKPKNNGSFKLVDATDVEMSNGEDLQTYLDNLDMSGTTGSNDEEVYIGLVEPTNSKYKIWVDTSKNNIDKTLSSLIIEEFRTIISSLTSKVEALEKEVAYLKAVIDPGDIDIPDQDINAQILINENNDILINEDGKILCFQVANENEATQIFVNENNDILVNENGEILCLEVYDMVLINDKDQLLVNENNKILKL